MAYFMVILAVAALFYAVIPGIGAFYVRSRWRLFRRQINESSLYPLAGYRHLHGGTDGPIGNFRFFGELEAIQSDDVVWLRNDELSVSAELSRVPVYWLPSYASENREGREETNEETLPDEMPTQVSWHRVFSLPEGTRVFLSGPLHREKGSGVFRPTRETPLTVVLYDGDRDSILRRAIWGGRHRNEYWNPFTPASLAAGSFGLLILAYLLLRAPLFRIPAIFALAGSVLPVMPLLPPGVLLIFLYRSWWKRARFLRAERDLVLLPLRHFPQFTGREDKIITDLPGGDHLTVERFEGLAEAIAKLGTGKIRRAVRLSARTRTSAFYLFAASPPRDAAAVTDPMVERVLITGNPLEMSRLCSRTARRFELLSSAAFIAGMIVNLMWVVLVLSTLIR